LEGKTIHLEDLVVKESMRGTGLGYALYSSNKARTKKIKCAVEWNVLDWNTPAIDFFMKSGAKSTVGLWCKWTKQVLQTLLKIN
jgi:GNAT superfamily N-acetyltransferase